MMDETYTIPHTVAEEIFKDFLVKDYRFCQKQIARLKAMDRPLEEHEKEDLTYNYRLIEAMETLIDYYFLADEITEILNK